MFYGKAQIYKLWTKNYKINIYKGDILFENQRLDRDK